MAKLLTRHGIKFKYSKEFETVDKDGNPNHREVDFWLEEPIEIFWCDTPVQAIEVKGGRLDQRCLSQKEELQNAGINTFIALPAYISFFEHEGFLKSEGLFRKKTRRRRM